MGYYDNQQVANLTGRNAPYDVKDILLGTNAVTGGVDKLVANAAAERVSSQQDQANQYISSLMSNTNTSNYDVNMPKIRVLAQFASPQMIAQLQGLTTDIKNKNDFTIAQQNSNNGTITANAAKQVAGNGTTDSETKKQAEIDTKSYQDKLIANEQDRINAQRYATLMGYNASIYGSDVSAGNNSNTNRTALITNQNNVGAENYRTDATVKLGNDKNLATIEKITQPNMRVDKNGRPYNTKDASSAQQFDMSAYVNKNRH
jgi:hypothetical protein